ncbi:MAG: hypothetical protein A3K18_19140 [Lentisphaerae bacterium RIFOXYA12_64_32]|nr:MAG: hypothetical protein A3K18_19140 [Lentisphaerae bacterium RIFOXYA12_64_32]
MRIAITCCLGLYLSAAATGEDLFRASFDASGTEPPLVHAWGDKPTVTVNAVEPGVGLNGTAAAHLKATYPDPVQNKLSYWAYSLRDPVPLVPQLETISFQVKTNVPVSIKVGIAPFGFIYHGPGVGASEQWQQVTLPNAYESLKNWCTKGQADPDQAAVGSIIVAVADSAGVTADVIVDDIVFAGAQGARQAMDGAVLERRIKRVKVAAISLVWEEGQRTLANTLAALDEAGKLGADLACLPQECVEQPAEPIPGPSSTAIAQKAAEYKMYVVGNLLEKDGEKTYVTSFLCDREGKIAGVYRKSHRLPCEADIALGDDLPTFSTDFGCIGMKIGTDHFFPEIDRVLRSRGASLVVWSTKPFAFRDENYFAQALKGRAMQNGLHLIVAQYAGKQGYGGYADRFSWTASWPLGRAQVYAPDGHTLADSGHDGGVALAAIPRARLGGRSGDGGYATTGTFALITATEPLPAPPKRDGKRVIKAAAIECEGNFDRLIAKLDECGKQGCDIACLWEYVWYNTDEEVEKNKERNRGYLARLAEAAKRNNMYVVIAGELERGFNESILFDRQGTEIGRYTKILQTTSKDSKYYREGDRVGVFDLDFGRICTKICNDVNGPDIDRVAALHQVDLLLLHTQDGGPYSENIRTREMHRCIDCGYYLLRAGSQGTETDHRSYIMDPWGMVLAGSQLWVDNAPLIATLNLNNRPQYYEWPDAVRQAGDMPDPVKRGIPEEDSLKMYGRFNRPVAKGDLRATILQNRRPELYRPRGKK